MIQPTVGRVVWYWENRGWREKSREDRRYQPIAAIVTYVHSERLVNLATLTGLGESVGRSRVILVQEGDDLPEGAFCEWMPYQKGQAVKVDELKAMIDRLKMQAIREEQKP